MFVCVLSRVLLFATPWTIVCQASLSIEFSRKEYWSGLPFPLPGDLLNPGTEPASLASPASAGRFFTTEPSGTVVHWILLYVDTARMQDYFMQDITEVKNIVPALGGEAEMAEHHWTSRWVMLCKSWHGTSLVVQWFQCRGHRFSPWSGK